MQVNSLVVIYFLYGLAFFSMGLLVATEGVPLAFEPTTVLVAAFMNGIIAMPVATLFGAIERRFGTAERVDW